MNQSSNQNFLVEEEKKGEVANEGKVQDFHNSYDSNFNKNVDNFSVDPKPFPRPSQKPSEQYYNVNNMRSELTQAGEIK
jgi:hypothetical protein